MQQWKQKADLICSALLTTVSRRTALALSASTFSCNSPFTALIWCCIKSRVTCNSLHNNHQHSLLHYTYIQPCDCSINIQSSHITWSNWRKAAVLQCSAVQTKCSSPFARHVGATVTLDLFYARPRLLSQSHSIIVPDYTRWWQLAESYNTTVNGWELNKWLVNSECELSHDSEWLRIE